MFNVFKATLKVDILHFSKMFGRGIANVIQPVRKIIIISCLQRPRAFVQISLYVIIRILLSFSGESLDDAEIDEQ